MSFQYYGRHMLWLRVVPISAGLCVRLASSTKLSFANCKLHITPVQPSSVGPIDSGVFTAIRSCKQAKLHTELHDSYDVKTMGGDNVRLNCLTSENDPYFTW